MPIENPHALRRSTRPAQVVEDDVDVQIFRDVSVDRPQEDQELLVPLAVLEFCNHSAVEVLSAAKRYFVPFLL